MASAKHIKIFLKAEIIVCHIGRMRHADITKRRITAALAGNFSLIRRIAQRKAIACHVVKEPRIRRNIADEIVAAVLFLQMNLHIQAGCGFRITLFLAALQIAVIEHDLGIVRCGIIGLHQAVKLCKRRGIERSMARIRNLIGIRLVLCIIDLLQIQIFRSQKARV